MACSFSLLADREALPNLPQKIPAPNAVTLRHVLRLGTGVSLKVNRQGAGSHLEGDRRRSVIL